MTLSQVPRELAERLVPHPQTCTEQYCTCTGWLIESRFRVEAVIREAMQKAFEIAATEGALAGGKWGADVRLAIETAANSLTEQETKP